jgi:glycerol uptake facilitator protein
MNAYLAEFVGTALLVLMGNGVVANVVLARTKGTASGWIVICAGWGGAVYTGVLCVQQFSGAHLNPAVTVALVAVERFSIDDALGYIAAQLLGALVGGTLVYLFYRSHYELTSDADAKLATFCTAPNVRSWFGSLTCEVIATFVLIYAVLLAQTPGFELSSEQGAQAVEVGLGALGALPVALIVFAIGLSLGGTTGYAINPARDLGPRIAHAILPIPGKRDSDWGYAPVPVIGPILGALLAALWHLATNNSTP